MLVLNAVCSRAKVGLYLISTNGISIGMHLGGYLYSHVKMLTHVLSLDQLTRLQQQVLDAAVSDVDPNRNCSQDTG